MKKDFVKRELSLCFSKIGYYIGCHPQWFIASFFLITVVLATGFFKLSMVNDIEYLYSPINGRSKIERKSVESMFPVDISTNNDVTRTSRFGRMGTIIATSNDNDYMMNNASVMDLVKLDRIIQNISIFWNNSFFRYQDLCPKNKYNKCHKNFVLYLKEKLEGIKYGRKFLRYPSERTALDVKINALNLGGVLTNKLGYVEDFKAVRFFYFLDYSTEERNKISLMWEKAFINILSNVKFRNIQFFMFTSQSSNIESSRNSELSVHLIFICIPMMIFFAVITCMPGNAVTSKPWIGIAAYLSPFLATIAAFGLLLHCNMEYVDVNMSALFLMIGIGIDDAFVLLASWRRTNKEDSVEKRMSDTFAEAAVSITITSLTNLLSICLGLISPFRIIRIFSAYTSLSILFDYIYQIFFFGGLMALDGYREKYNLHGIFLYSVQPKPLETKVGSERNTRQLNENTFITYITENLGKFLGKRIVKIIIICMFTCSVIGSVISMNEIKQGLQFIEIFPFSSYATKFMNAHYKYFTDYSHYIQVVFNQTLDYSNPIVQNDIQNIVRNFEHLPYAKNSATTQCWLNEYLRYIKNPRINYLIKDFNTDDSKGFLNGFKEVFLKYKLGSRFENDVFWNKEGDQILASRCFILYGDVRNASSEKLLLEEVRRIAAESKYKVFVNNLWFVIYDQYLNMPIICLQSLCAATIMVTIVFLIIMVDLSCVIFVALNIIFIQIQTIGYMSWWNVSLDQISVTILVMCVGLCVDYSAHIAYAYKSCRQKEPNEKIKASLYLAGYPVVQGCLSTLIGVTALKFGPSYIFVIYFKIVFLIMFFSAFNGLLLLPVLLSIGDSLHISCKKKNVK